MSSSKLILDYLGKMIVKTMLFPLALKFFIDVGILPVCNYGILIDSIENDHTHYTKKGHRHNSNKCVNHTQI